MRNKKTYSYLANINTGEVTRLHPQDERIPHLLNKRVNGLRVWYYTTKHMFNRSRDFLKGEVPYPPLFIQKNHKTGKAELVNVIIKV